MTNPPINYRAMLQPDDPSSEQTEQQIAAYPRLEPARSFDKSGVVHMTDGGNRALVISPTSALEPFRTADASGERRCPTRFRAMTSAQAE